MEKVTLYSGYNKIMFLFDDEDEANEFKHLATRHTIETGMKVYFEYLPDERAEEEKSPTVEE